MTTKEAYEQGYYQAKADCLRLLAKWFFMTKPGARSCRDEMQSLAPTAPK